MLFVSGHPWQSPNNRGGRGMQPVFGLGRAQEQFSSTTGAASADGMQPVSPAAPRADLRQIALLTLGGTYGSAMGGGGSSRCLCPSLAALMRGPG